MSGKLTEREGIMVKKTLCNWEVSNKSKMKKKKAWEVFIYYKYVRHQMSTYHDYKSNKKSCNKPNDFYTNQKVVLSLQPYVIFTA